MARTLHSSTLETRTARLKLTARGKPYTGPTLARGVSQTYRRLEDSNGSWVARVANGRGGYTYKVVAEADDYEESNGKSVLNYHEAQTEIRQFGRGDGGTATVESAFVAYRADLIVGSSDPYNNADWPRVHLTPALLKRPIALLTVAELEKWRNSLVGTLAIGSLNRLSICVRAALNLAARQDPRLKSNQDAWEIGLAGLPNPERAHNVILPDDKVSAFIDGSYDLDYQFGLFIEVAAVTGARPSQLVRLRVDDLLLDDPKRPRLMMPRSGKGGDRCRVERKTTRYPIPITAELATKLQVAARGRDDSEPLLLREGNKPWLSTGGRLYSKYRRRVQRVVASLGLDPTDVTVYCLRHSSITSMLMKGTPVRVVATLHDTSVQMIEAHYSRDISEHSDDVSRAALLQRKLSGSNVIKLDGTMKARQARSSRR